MKLRIGPIKVTVSEKDEDELDELFCDDDLTIGGVYAPNGDYSQIWLHKDLQGIMRPKTLLHEVIEAINAIYGLDFDHQQITTLDAALLQVLRDNKPLVAQLTR